MRLIDADAIAEMLGITDMDCSKCAWGDHGFCRRGGDFEDACVAIEDAPTIDAVPVVRCRECRWWDKIGDSPIGYCLACKHGHYSSKWEISIRRTYRGDFFCADGERSGGDGDG